METCAFGRKAEPTRTPTLALPDHRHGWPAYPDLISLHTLFLRVPSGVLIELIRGSRDGRTACVD